jgi:hypothetical protein
MATKVVELLGNDISSIIRKFLLPEQDKNKIINDLNNIFQFINSGYIKWRWDDFKPSSIKYYCSFMNESFIEI